MNEPWVWAALAAGAGLVVGALAGRAVRVLMTRRASLADVAPAAGALVLWGSVAAGLALALATISPETLRPLPSRILEWLPNAVVAGVVLIAGRVLGVTAGVALGRMTERATGRPQATVQAAVRWSVTGAALLVALGQVGVDTTVLNLLVGVTAAAVALTLAGLAVAGGREVAAQLAAGRAIGVHLPEGTVILWEGEPATVEDTGPTHAVLRAPSGRVLVPWTTLAGAPLTLPEDAEADPGPGVVR